MSIRLAKLSERNYIQDFIHNNWKNYHVLSTSTELFDYLYLNEVESCYNIFISVDNNNISGMLGFIKASHYDQNLPNDMDICWCSVWKVLETNSQKLLGLSLLRTLLDTNKNIRRSTVGANINTLPIYRALGYQTGTLCQFVALNEACEYPQLVKYALNYRRQINKSNYDAGDNISLSVLDGKDIYSARDEIDRYAFLSISHRTFDYLNTRYIKNPFYKYKLAKLSCKFNSLYIVFRKIIYDNDSMLKIVDLMGDHSLISRFNSDLRKKLMGNSEYIELSCFGLEKELLDAGFIDLTASHDIRIPKYFEPLVYDPSPINWSMLDMNNSTKPLIFCGDADMDRPNFINIHQ